MLSELMVSNTKQLLNLGNGTGLTLSQKTALKAVEEKQRKTLY